MKRGRVTVMILYLLLLAAVVVLFALALSTPAEGAQIQDDRGSYTATPARAKIYHAPVEAVESNNDDPSPTPWGGWNPDGTCDRDCVVLCGPNLSEEQCAAYQVQMTAQASAGEDPYPAPETTPETGYPAP